MRRRGRARKNPSAGVWIALAAGAAALGAGVYFLTKSSSSTSTPQLTQSKAPVGSASDSNSVAYACNAAWRLNALGHTAEAAYWVSKCNAGGGVVPTSAAQQYK